MRRNRKSYEAIISFKTSNVTRTEVCLLDYDVYKRVQIFRDTQRVDDSAGKVCIVTKDVASTKFGLEAVND